MAASLAWQVADELFELLRNPDGFGVCDSRGEMRRTLEEALENRACEVIAAPHKVAAGEVEKDQAAHACPSCHTVNPKIGVSGLIAQIPGMGEVVLSRTFCGECRVLFGVQVLELQTAGLAAQKAGMAPPSLGGLWTPGRPRN